MSSIAGYSGGIAPKNAEGKTSAEFARMATHNGQYDIAGWDTFADPYARWDLVH